MQCCRTVALVFAWALLASSLPNVLIAEEIWTVREGSTVISLDLDRLAQFGVRVPLSEANGSAATNQTEYIRRFALPIEADSTLTFSVENGSVLEFLGGRIVHAGSLPLVDESGTFPLTGLTISQARDVTATGGWSIGSLAGADDLVIHRVVMGFNAASQTLTIHSPDIHVSPSLAAALGIPNLAGTGLGSVTTHAVAEWVGGDKPEPPVPQDKDGGGEPRDPTGCDMTFCQLFALAQYGRSEDIVGLAVATTAWNLGDADCHWFPSPSADHAFIVMNLFRLKDDRIEQIGQSWVKHTFYALGNTQCGGSCSFESGHHQGNWLGQGCTDTYSAPLNAIQSGMGPRHEVNPWTGVWTYEGSHMSSPHGHDGQIEHRLQAHDADLDPAQNPGATYYIEGFYLMFDDVSLMNNASWKPVTISGSPEGLWTFSLSDSGTMPESSFAINAWEGTQQTILAQETPVIEFQSPDGRCVLAAKATDLGSGWWHYEYALLNVDMDRKAGSFSIPKLPETVVANVGFHAVEHHDEEEAGYYNTPWSVDVTAEAITWSTLDNPVRWGTMYNFRFDADEPPDGVWGTTVTLGLFEPGEPDVLTGNTVGPYAGPQDCQPNDIPDECDLDCGPPDGECDVEGCGQSQDCNVNSIPDECEPDCNNNDIADECEVPPIGPADNDCNLNGTPDECEVPPIGPAEGDCNSNSVPDDCDVDPLDPDGNGEVSEDCQPNDIPDECEIAVADCNENGVPDDCDADNGTSQDCNDNDTPDECEIDENSSAPGGPFFCTEACDPDCNNNGVPDACDVSSGTSDDCNENGLPDECEGFPLCGNDHCQLATVICPGSYPGSTTDMDRDGAAGCGSMYSPDVWYSYTPATRGGITVELCGTANYNTVLSIHSSCPGVPGNQLACDDDGCSGTNESRLSIWAGTGGVTYLIRVSGYDGDSGDFVLTLTGPECEPPGDPIRGGLWWDTWWGVGVAPEPEGDHMLYPPEGQQSGNTTHRCKECHGWDYKGADGAYGSGSHYTGIPGVLGSSMTRGEVFNLIKLDSMPNGHGFGDARLRDQNIWDLAEFLQALLIDTDTYIVYVDGSPRFQGNSNEGKINFNTPPPGGEIACSDCHGTAGTAINFGAPEDPEWLGTVAVINPWEFLHKIRFGHPGAPMPSWLEGDGTDQGAADIGKYCQMNCCTHPPDGDMNGDGDTDGADIHLFVDAVTRLSTEPADLCPGDFHHDGMVDSADVSGMVDALLTP